MWMMSHTGIELRFERIGAEEALQSMIDQIVDGRTDLVFAYLAQRGDLRRGLMSMVRG